jgi:hypothetical protein
VRVALTLPVALTVVLHDVAYAVMAKQQTERKPSGLIKKGLLHKEKSSFF